MVTEAQLILAAKQAATKAYAPYSCFFVGAAAWFSDSSRIYTGCNVENTSYGLTICAERNAICSGIIDGCTALKSIAIAVCGAAGVMHCGACLQFISEFSDDKTTIYVDGLGSWLLTDLLPHPFFNA